MVSRYKEQAKSLKAPDQFQVQALSFLDTLVKNGRLLGMIAVPVLLVIAGAFGVQYWNAHKKEARLDELGKVQVAFDAETKKAVDARQLLQKQAEALDAAAEKTAPKPAPGQPAPPPDAKLVAQKAALDKQMEAIKPDHADSVGKLVDFYKKYPDHAEGWMAGVQAAHIYIDEDKLTEARALLEDILAKAKADPFYQVQGGLALVGLYEEAGDYDKGLTEVDAIEKVANVDLVPKLLLARGRLQMLKNAKADAKATLNGLIEKHASSPEAQKARSMIALLNG